MEAATWHPQWTLGLPRLGRPARRALQGRVVVLVMVAVLFGALAMFGRPAPGRAYDPHGAGFKWSAVDPQTGQPVTRTEWMARALEAV